VFVLGGLLRILVVALVVLVAAMFLLPRANRGAPPETATVLPEPRMLPDVGFVADDGSEIALHDLKGNFTLLFFGFTNCPDVCPLTLKVLADVRAELVRRAPRAVPRVVFVSVDPERDSPQRIASYLNAFDPEFLGVTAADDKLAPLLATLGVAVEKHAHGGESYNVVHSSAIYVLDPDAEWIAVSTAPHDPTVIARDFLRIRQRESGDAAPDA
jgi:protein SCO1/2